MRREVRKCVSYVRQVFQHNRNVQWQFSLLPTFSYFLLHFLFFHINLLFSNFSEFLTGKSVNIDNVLRHFSSCVCLFCAAFLKCLTSPSAGKVCLNIDYFISNWCGRNWHERKEGWYNIRVCKYFRIGWKNSRMSEIRHNNDLC